MFAGFNVVVNSKEKFYSYYDSGLSIYNKHKRVITDSLENYINPDESLSEKDIENDWFPKIDAHVFLSHSHNDLKFEYHLLAGCIRNSKLRHLLILAYGKIQILY